MSTTNNLQTPNLRSDDGTRRDSVARFADSAIACGDISTATHHAFTSPPALGRSDTDEPGVPGAFPGTDNHEKTQAARGSHSYNWHPLPSQETPSVSQMGVGSLPGLNDEFGVALLPDERQNINDDDHRATMKVDLPTHEQPSGARAGVGSLPGLNSEFGVALLPDERHSNLREEEGDEDLGQLPSSERPSGSRIGIGSMPGKNTESGVATLPAERIDGRPYGHGHTGFENFLGYPRNNAEGSRPTPANAKAPAQPQAQTPTVQTSPGHVQVESPSEETIFSATQRAKAQDPSFVLDTDAIFRGFVRHAPSKDMPNPSESLRGIGASAGHAAQDAGDLAGGVFDNAESAAANIYHGAENMLHNFRAYLSGGSGSAVADPEIAAPRGRGNTITSDTQAHGRGETSGTVAQDVSHLSFPPIESRGGPTTLPSFLQTEYYKDAGRAAAPEVDDQQPNADKLPQANTVLRPTDDYKSNIRADGAQDRDVGVGCGGVQFYLDGSDGMLPGYPTANGMQQLISDRMKDDRLRAAGAENATSSSSSSIEDQSAEEGRRSQFMRAESGISNRAVYGSHSHLPSGSVSPDPAVGDHAIIEERREALVGEGTGLTPDEATAGPRTGGPLASGLSSATGRSIHFDSELPARAPERFTTKDYASPEGDHLPPSGSYYSQSAEKHPSETDERLKLKNQKTSTYPFQSTDSPGQGSLPADRNGEMLSKLYIGQAHQSGENSAFKSQRGGVPANVQEPVVDPVVPSTIGGTLGYLGKPVDKLGAQKEFKKAQRLGKTRMGLN